MARRSCHPAGLVGRPRSDLAVSRKNCYASIVLIRRRGTWTSTARGLGRRPPHHLENEPPARVRGHEAQQDFVVRGGAHIRGVWKTHQRGELLRDKYGPRSKHLSAVCDELGEEGLVELFSEHFYDYELTRYAHSSRPTSRASAAKRLHLSIGGLASSTSTPPRRSASSFTTTAGNSGDGRGTPALRFPGREDPRAPQ